MVNRERLLSTFLDLVKIDSITFSEAGVAAYMAERLRALGASVEIDRAGERLGGNSGNVVARLATGDGDETPILFAAHMDTVEPGRGIEPVVAKGVVRSKGNTVLGADDKAGCAVILECLETLAEGGRVHRPIEAVFTVAEEKGLLGAKELDFKRLRARVAFVMDGDGPIGGIVVKAPFQDAVKGVFAGKAAHAGVNPEKGVSAIRAAALAISSMKLGRLDDETTANIGMIKGGRAMNIVPDETVIEGEARSQDAGKLDAQVGAMRRAMAEAARLVGAKVKVEVTHLYDGFSFAPDAEVVSQAGQAIRRAGGEPDLVSSGGGSDTNIFNEAGMAAVNLSCGARDVHTVDERVAVDDMARAAAVALALVGG